MVRPKLYHDRTSTSLSLEKQMLADFLDLCHKERKTLTEKLNEMVQEELEKNAIGNETNPIAIPYKNTVLSQEGRNTLDYYIDKGYVTQKHFISEFMEKPEELLNRYQALGVTIAAAVKQVSYHRRTGKYLIS